MDKQKELQKEIQEEHFSATYTKAPGCMVHFEAKLAPASVEEHFKKGVKAVKKHVSIPGFRKGKAPDEVVKESFKKDIEREQKNSILQYALDRCVKLSELKPFGQQAVKRANIKAMSTENGAEVTLSIEVEPEVPKIEVENIETEITKAEEVTDEAVNRAYHRLQIGSATWEEVTERAIQPGDFVELDIDVVEHPAHNVCTNQLFPVDDKELPKWLMDTIVGMNVDENKEVVAKYIKDDPGHIFVHDENTPEKKCLVAVKKIKKAILPEETAEFAEKFGCKDIDELKQKIRENLEHEANVYADEVSRYNLRRELLEKYPIDLPQSMIDAEVRARFAYCKQGVDKSKGALPTDQKDKEIKAQIEAETRGFFAWMNLLKQFSTDADVSSSQHELEQEYQRQMQIPKEHRLIYPGLNPEEVRHRLFMLILMKRLEEHLLNLKKELASNET